MLLYVLDLFGVAVFAASGALAGIASRLDLLGIIVLASITAIGGGTLRDVLLNRHPIFWMHDSGPIWTILAATAATLLWVQVLPVPTDALLIADAIGLAVFAISGAQVAEKAGCRPMVTVLMGTLTGSGGGVLRDVLSAKVPLILRQDIYATAAIAGIAVYLLARAAKVSTAWAFAAGAVTVAGTRLAAIAYDLKLPVFSAVS
ncbi:trimeric intracellular cation channel family protein [Piscinibacter gummiphilus]|uniref:Trimeric intracellular cation channel family protein n=1 Tax=Piscinibacter gummiphilus TaxID=946333 RepID=A0ABZ0CZ54_9BURK|nr:trimeric intracellular cation channel family protein [Piscinibacter gummiphilus]WOB08262.1 trimeric intracellular cation channel family protein [Piscinibacter gummiphilus]